MGLVAKWDQKEIVPVRRSCGFEIRRQKKAASLHSGAALLTIN